MEKIHPFKRLKQAITARESCDLDRTALSRLSQHMAGENITAITDSIDNQQLLAEKEIESAILEAKRQNLFSMDFIRQFPIELFN